MSDNLDITNTGTNAESDSAANTEEKEYEKVCFMCRRPESKAGKMIDLPGNISVCPDCMQKAFDIMNNGDMSNMMNMSNMPNMQHMDFQNMPNVSFINLADLQNSIPRPQQVKKKKKEEKPQKAFDIHSIPAPHKIKARLDDYVIGQ